MKCSMNKDNNIKGIMEMLPHRYPFLLIDKIIHVVPNESAIAIKNVTINEPFFQGHFPGHPVMPGVLIIEAMAQAGVALVTHSVEDIAGKIMYLISIEKAHFRRIVEPGDTMELHVFKTFARHNAWKMKGEARVNNMVVADAEFSAMLAQK
jgi:3-hydroxyacyl-[acyl-carrier-protein] dehydratase